MKFSGFATILSITGLTLAAPATLEKRVSASITLFAETNYGGASYNIPFNINESTCVAATLPGSIDRQASSVRLSAEGSESGFNCRLVANQNCNIDSTENATWFFNFNIPDLANPDYALDNRARSVLCSPV